MKNKLNNLLLAYNDRWGIILRLASFWIGIHYSYHNERWCINIFPCVTFWFTSAQGNAPSQDKPEKEFVDLKVAKEVKLLDNLIAKCKEDKLTLEETIDYIVNETGIIRGIVIKYLVQKGAIMDYAKYPIYRVES